MTAPAAAPVVVTDHWSLDAHPAELRAAAARWRALATALETASTDLTSAADRVRGAWRGAAHDAYQARRATLTGHLGDLAVAARGAGDTTDDMAGVLEEAGRGLDASWARAVDVAPALPTLGVVMFLVRTPQEAERVRAEATTASDLRATLDRRLSELTDAVRGPAAAFTAVPGALPSAGRGDPDWVPPGVGGQDPGLTVVTGADGVLVTTGDEAGTDEVTIGDSPIPGLVRVSSGGESVDVAAGTPLTVNTGDSDDQVTVGGAGAEKATLVTGEGDDEVVGTGAGMPLAVVSGSGADTVRTGSRDDRVSAGRDRDYVQGNDGADSLEGGEGDDTVYGLDGDDTLSGGSGQDYLEGGADDDRLVAGDDGGVLSGGSGDDTIGGGSGDDVVYAGEGHDTVTGGGGEDTAYVEDGDTAADDVETDETVDLEGTPGEYVEVEGSEEFVDRTNADLEMLRSSPTGQEMLDSLQEAHEDSEAPAADWPVLGGISYQGDPLVISEYPESDNSFANSSTDFWSWPHEDHGVRYSQTVDEIDGAPPSAVLYHELGHVWDYTHDTTIDGQYGGPGPDGPTGGDEGVDNSERQAVGLPVDHDDDPSTPEIVDPDHPLVYTENGLRDEFGWESRDSYR